MSESIREQVLGAFAAKADGEAKLAADRREAAAKAGVVRGPYAKEGRWRTALAALTAIPGENWAAMADWLDRHVIGSEVLHYTGTKAAPTPEVAPDAPGSNRVRAGVKKGESWIGAETDAITFTRARLAEAVKSLEAALSPKGLDNARWERTDLTPEADLPGRMGISYFDTVDAVESAFVAARAAQQVIASGDRVRVTEMSDEDFAAWEPYLDFAPGEDRRPAPRAFPELMQFWTEDAHQDQSAKEAFLVFGGAVLTAAAKAAGEAVPTALLDGLEHAYKQHCKRG